MTFWLSNDQNWLVILVVPEELAAELTISNIQDVTANALNDFCDLTLRQV